MSTNSSISSSFLSVFTSFREKTELPRSQSDLTTLCSDQNQGGVLKKHREREKKKREKRRHGWEVESLETALRVWLNLWGFPQWKQHLMRGGFWRAPLDGIHVQGCRNSQGHIHFFRQDLDKERKLTDFLPASYCNKGFSVRQCSCASVSTGYGSWCLTRQQCLWFEALTLEHLSHLLCDILFIWAHIVTAESLYQCVSS